MATLTPLRKGQQLFLKGDLPESIKAFSQAIEEGEDLFTAHMGRGMALLKRGDPALAVADFSESVALGEDPERVHFYRGIAYLNKGDFAKAIRDLTASLTLNPEQGAALIARGLAFAEQGLKDKAEVDFHRANQLHDMEIGSFLEEFAISRTIFDRSIALFEGGPETWNLELTNDEVLRMNQ